MKSLFSHLCSYSVAFTRTQKAKRNPAKHSACGYEETFFCTDIVFWQALFDVSRISLFFHAFKSKNRHNCIFVGYGQKHRQRFVKVTEESSFLRAFACIPLSNLSNQSAPTLYILLFMQKTIKSPTKPPLALCVHCDIINTKTAGGKSLWQ